MKPVRVCGIDEAGRGALAGPLVAAAVVLPKKTIKTVSRRAKTKTRDGKLLTAKQRQKIYGILKRLRAEIAIEIVSARSINNHGIGWANRQAMKRLIKRVSADEYILDGKIKVGRVWGKTNKIRSVVDADATLAPVILAGIVAKVERDNLMVGLHRQFPHFGWRRNKGYGTRTHLEALGVFPETHYHRHVFVTSALRQSAQTVAVKPAAH